MDPGEFTIRGEKKLFQAYVLWPLQPETTREHGTHTKCRRITDDGFWHYLIVYQDIMTGGIRLEATVWDGELRLCPVWTAFGKDRPPFFSTPFFPPPRIRESFLMLTFTAQLLTMFPHPTG
jgi:hypothetical protein